MISITKPKTNRIDLKIDGAIDADAMRTALDDLIALSEDISHGRMFYEITDFSMPTLGAMGVEFRRMPKLFGLLGKFDKCAVLTDTGWLRTAAEVEGAISPGIEIKSFEGGDVKGAEAWLANGT